MEKTGTFLSTIIGKNKSNTSTYLPLVYDIRSTLKDFMWDTRIEFAW